LPILRVTRRVKLVPVYKEYYGVVQAMNGLLSQAGIETATIEDIRSKLNFSFNMQYV
jgi:hypothetical protein